MSAIHPRPLANKPAYSEVAAMCVKQSCHGELPHQSPHVSGRFLRDLATRVPCVLFGGRQAHFMSSYIPRCLAPGCVALLSLRFNPVLQDFHSVCHSRTPHGRPTTHTCASMHADTHQRHMQALMHTRS
eukprot:10338087-Alexandrium_andersonii.AAC.1